MASIKVKFRPSATESPEGTIVFQIIHERKTRLLFSDYRINHDEWDEKRSTIISAIQNERRESLLALRDNIHCVLERLSRIDRQLEKTALPYSVDDIIDEYNFYLSEFSLVSYMQRLIDNLVKKGNLRTSETYTSTLHNFRKFLRENPGRPDTLPQADIMLDRLSSEIMEMYEAWNLRRGITYNTISFYNRILRAVYNRAVEQGAIDDRNPFKRVYTGVDKTVKRAVPMTVIKKIKSLDLTKSPSLDFARDMFLMSFYLRGMSFIDMAFLKKSDLCNGHIIYRRRKTGQQLIIGWTKEMQAIIDKYPVNDTIYLLPVITNSEINARATYRKISCNINRSLKRIATMIGEQIKLTLYVARHSWASAAKVMGIPISVISEGMGHDSEATTQIYLASLDATVVDQANFLILSAL